MKLSPNPIIQAAASTRRESLRSDRRHIRLIRAEHKAHLRHLADVSHAERHIERLPTPAESFHCLMGGNYNAWDLVPAVLNLLGAARLDELRVATLGFNRRNGRELIELLDAGRIAACSFICSTYYQAHEQNTYAWLAAEMTARGQPIACARCHAKILLMRSAAGHWLVNESSANLRSCNNLEQFSLFNNEALYHFHAAWMGEVLTQA